jgi:hypothetical protein
LYVKQRDSDASLWFTCGEFTAPGVVIIGHEEPALLR